MYKENATCLESFDLYFIESGLLRILLNWIFFLNNGMKKKTVIFVPFLEIICFRTGLLIVILFVLTYWITNKRFIFDKKKKRNHNGFCMWSVQLSTEHVVSI